MLKTINVTENSAPKLTFSFSAKAALEKHDIV